MSWHYACVKKESEFGDGYEYHLVEAYPELAAIEEGLIPYAENALFIAESPEELAKWLRMAADDIEKYGEIPAADK